MPWKEGEAQRKQIPSSPPAIAPAAWWVGGCRQQVKNILDANGFLQYKRHNILRQFSSIETSRAQKGGGGKLSARWRFMFF